MLRYLDPNPDHADLKNVFFAGMASGTAICLLSPVELVKIRSQMVTDGKRGPVSVIRELYQNGGIFSKNGLFRGFTAQLARDPFGYSIYFVPLQSYSGSLMKLVVMEVRQLVLSLLEHLPVPLPGLLR